MNAARLGQFTLAMLLAGGAWAIGAALWAQSALPPARQPAPSPETLQRPPAARPVLATEDIVATPRPTPVARPLTVRALPDGTPLETASIAPPPLLPVGPAPRIVTPDLTRLPIVALTRSADTASATMSDNPVADLVSPMVLASRPPLRQAPAPFLPLTIPDPDNRTGTAKVPPAPDTLLALPTSTPAKPRL